MADCVFCKIVTGEIPSHGVYEDDLTVAFMLGPVGRPRTRCRPEGFGWTGGTEGSLRLC